jgi:hypothetical protein
MGLVLLLAAAACRGKGENPPPPRLTWGQPPKPVDHLAKNELVEGKETALGLVLPRDLKIVSGSRESVVARGDVAPELVANYIRARVGGGSVTLGAAQTRFERVTVLKEPGPELAIRVGASRFARCEIEVTDVTPPPEVPGDQAAKFKAANIGSDGKPVDKLHFE